MNGFALEILKKNKDRLDKVALIDRNGSRKITWDSLSDKICRVAAYARNKGIKGIVPVYMDRGMEVTATLLGLNLAGVGVAPLSITTPLSRCRNIAEQVKNEIWTIDTFSKACECKPAYELCKEGKEADPSYVVFTSGSTGIPKGVVLSNRAMLGGMYRAISKEFYDLNQNDRMLQSSSLSFIALDQDLLAPLYAGALVYVLPEESRGDLRIIEDFINRHGITCLFMSPQMYRNFEGGPSLKCVCTGSDRIVNIAPKGHRLVGVYGMTEMAGYAFHYQITKAMESTPIGEPWDDIKAYVLDEDGNETDEGELCVSGAVAHAYFERYELNKMTFTPNPFSDDPEHSYLLHSGDIVRRIPEGGFLFINRNDNMMKVNGQRVEPGEIESVIMRFPGVDVAVAKGFTDENQRSIICAFYTIKWQVDEDRLRTFISDKLPHYMVPSVFVKMDAMPLNSNGKLDRKSLQMPDLSQYLSEYEKPVGDRELTICKAFEKVLGLEKVGRNDDFFKIGGDSISALTVVDECASIGISTGDIFAGRTPKSIASLSVSLSYDAYNDLTEGVKKAVLTDSQMGILLECGLDEASTKYNIPVHMSFDRTGEMTAAYIKDAVDKVLKNHPALYSRIIEESGNFYMTRKDFPEDGICEVVETDGMGRAAMGETAYDAEIEKYARDIVKPIAIGRDPLCTAKAYLCSDKVHVFINMHHVVSDGSSVAALTEELSRVLKGEYITPETIDAFSLSEAEQRIKESQAMRDAKTYFEYLLSGVETDSNLISDHKAAEDGSRPLGRLSIELDSDMVEAYLKDKGFTESTFFMGVYGYVLAKMTGQNESVFGAAENGRGNALLKDTVSMLVKTLPVVLKVNEEQTGKELLTQLQSQFFTTMRNDCVGFSYLAKEYDIRSDVMFVYQGEMLNGSKDTEEKTADRIEEKTADRIEEKTTDRIGEKTEKRIDLDIIKTDELLNNFSLMILKKAKSYMLHFDYRSDMYEEYTIARFADVYRKAVTAFIDDIALKDIALISQADLQFLDEQNASNCGELKDETIIDIFRESVKKYPDKPVIIADGRSYTYAEADEISDRIAAYLIGEGIGRGSVVSVLIPRCEYMLIASMGIMKAGAAYQPLDPSYPEERLSFMTSDAKAALIIKDRKLDHILKGFEGKVLYTDEIPDLPPIDHPANSHPETGHSATDIQRIGHSANDIQANDHPATYIHATDTSTTKIELPHPSMDDIFILLYTSGTTGTPKGVMLSHGNLRAFVHAQAIMRELTEDSVVGQYASYGFDAHMHDIYPSIYLGCTIAVIPDDIRLDLVAIKDFCEMNKVTHLFMTTQVGRQFAVTFSDVKGLRVLDTAGEKLVSFTPSNSYKICNLYGPTEGTVCSTGFTIDKYYENIPIGKAIWNYRIYIADNYGRRMPIGVPGELIQCGPQVGIGYLGRPELTDKAFVANTFEDAGVNHKRCYKTGDIVRFINDGNIEFIGRRDHQVKIRGFRIELSEVEKAIRDYPGIQDATVSVIEGETGKNLCAYVVSDEKIDVNELNSFIGQSHPSYMIPAVTMQIDSIPLNVNGKVDKKKLPEPKLQIADAKRAETELQQNIFDKVAEAIGTDGFGVDTDIFMAGLSSIGSIRLCTLLAEEFGIPVKIRDLKRYSTVEKLEQFALKSKGEPIADVPEKEAVDKTDAVVEYGESYPITKTMEGIFVECMQRPDSTVYNIPLILKLGDSIDVARLKEAIAKTVEAHPCMKAELFSDKDGKIWQHRRKDDAYSEDEIKEIRLDSDAEINSGLIRAFALENSRLFEISIIHVDAVNYLFINIHHIIADGTSMAIFIRDVGKAYAGEEIREESFTSFDISGEELESRTEDELEYEKGYYRTLLDGLDKDFLLLSDKPMGKAEDSGRLVLTQMEADAEEIRTYCDEHKIGMNAFFVSAFGFTLAKYAGSDYSVFNTIYNGRNDSRRMDTIAMLVKTLPVVCNIDKDKVSDVTKQISAQLMDSMSNDLYSYAEISRELGVKNDVMFIYQGDSFSFENFCGEPAQEISLCLSEAKAAMSLQVMIKEGKIVYELEYDPKKFTEKLGIAFVQAVDKAAASFISTDDISKVSILSKAAEEEIEKFNDTEVEYDSSKTIVDHFLESVRKQPEHLCVEYNNKKLSFARVGELSAKLSLCLMNKGIGRGDVVSILINRDENMVIAAHGAIRSGAAYLGLDPTYPADRLEFMISDSGSKCLIADRSLMGIIGNYKGDVIYLDEIEGMPDASEDEMRRFLSSDKHKITPEDDALIVYSSGTTGVPKGSVLRHRNIVCFYHNYIGDNNIGPDSNLATYASFGFDGGAMDVFSAPMSGAALFVIPDDIRLDMGRLEQFYQKNNITNGFMTTQVGCMFISNTRCKSLRYFMVGGEKLIPVIGPDWVSLKNGYGPSETMCYVNRCEVHDVGALQPIGRVNNNTKEYIIDKFRNRLPFGACGEMCISGGQMGRGYLNRPEKTAEVFVENPFSDKAGYERMYRTGDVIRMLTDGNYDFVGRRDGQVKIRGFRIELGEVEQQIRKYPGVINTVVKACDNPSGGKFLAAYVVTGEKLDQEDLREFIGKEKPDYMIPAAIIRVDDIPLTSNGKVDMSKLPKPELGSTRKGRLPGNETEEKLCRIFADVIGTDKVYADDDFFKVGGSSISAIQVVVKCGQEGYPVVYKNLFANPTPEQLAAFILGGDNKSDVTASDLDKEDKYDYSALSYNVIANLPEIDNNGIGDVLLTGATGFLGSHIYHELIETTPSKVICLVRGREDLDAATRFEGMMTYYFEDWYQDSIKRRTIIIDGTLEDENIDEKLESYHFDTIINCAANVKHFAVEDELLKSNFSGVENMIDLAESRDAKLIQISSLSVGGESVNGSVPEGYIFKETDLNIGQSLENKYIYSKYLAEQAVIDAVSRKRIKGKVIRLGNLMARAEDSEFQINAGSNGFLRMFIGFTKLGCFPVDMLDSEVEFSPIDRVARAVILLSGTPDGFTVFHAKNCNTIHYSYLLKAVMDAGHPIEIVENEEFERRLQCAIKDDKKAAELGGLLAYRNSVDSRLRDATERLGDIDESSTAVRRIQIPSSTAFTTKALYRLGFGWPLISMDYLREMVNVLEDLDFFE